MNSFTRQYTSLRRRLHVWPKQIESLISALIHLLLLNQPPDKETSQLLGELTNLTVIMKIACAWFVG